MKIFVVAAALGLIAAPALADPAATGAAVTGGKAPPPPAFRALGQMVDECQQREAQSLAERFAMLDQVTSLQKQIADLVTEQKNASTKK